VKKYIVTILAGIFLISVPHQAKSEHQISFGVGSIRTLQDAQMFKDLPQWTVYPEVN